MNTTFTKPKRLTNKNLVFFFLVFFLSTAFSCKEDPPVIPPPPVIKDTLTISVTDLTHRSASLNVQCTMNNVHSLVRLYRLFNNNETLVSEFPINVQDTTIIDDNNGTGLQLNTNYFYYAVRIDPLGERKDSSNFVEATTLDTTSHNYTWQEFVIGDAGFNNALYDVWGTDENNVWACGGISINDSVHGLLHWDGTQWTPMGRGGGYAMFGFAADDIWTVGGSVFHYDGQSWNEVIDSDPVLLANIPYTSVWGTSSSNLYLGNQWGKIIHWDGSKATDFGVISNQKIADIIGKNENEIYVVSGEYLVEGGELFRLGDGGIESIAKINSTIGGTTFRGNFQSLWIENRNHLLLCGARMYEKIVNHWSDLGRINNSIILKIRGSKSNNLFSVGIPGLVAHNNGSNWFIYQGITNSNYILHSTMVFENSVFVVGYNQNFSTILYGKRN